MEPTRPDPRRPAGHPPSPGRAARLHESPWRARSPHPHRADWTRWTERVCAALMELSADFREHVAIAEAPDGINARALRSAARAWPGRPPPEQPSTSSSPRS